MVPRLVLDTVRSGKFHPFCLVIVGRIRNIHHHGIGRSSRDLFGNLEEKGELNAMVITKVGFGIGTNKKDLGIDKNVVRRNLRSVIRIRSEFEIRSLRVEGKNPVANGGRVAYIRFPNALE